MKMKMKMKMKAKMKVKTNTMLYEQIRCRRKKNYYVGH
jgi:hypothetical protein